MAASSTTRNERSNGVAVAVGLCALVMAALGRLTLAEGLIQLPGQLDQQIADVRHGLSPEETDYVAMASIGVALIALSIAYVNNWSGVSTAVPLLAFVLFAFGFASFLVFDTTSDLEKAVRDPPQSKQGAAMSALALIRPDLRVSCSPQRPHGREASRASCASNTGADSIVIQRYTTSEALMADANQTTGAQGSTSYSLDRHDETPKSWPRNGRSAGWVSVYTSYRIAHVDWVDIDNLTLGRLTRNDGGWQILENYWDDGSLLIAGGS